jgi:ATP synthase protein I
MVDLPESDIMARIQAAKAEAAANGNADAPKSDSGLSEQEVQNRSQGMRAGLELVVSFISGGVLGYALDHVFNTKPLFLIIFVFLGVITGFYNIYKISQGLGAAVGYKQLQSKQKTGK